MKNKYSWPIVSNKEISIVNRVLKSNKLNYWSGHKCQEFENKFNIYFQRNNNNINLINFNIQSGLLLYTN